MQWSDGWTPAGRSARRTCAVVVKSSWPCKINPWKLVSTNYRGQVFISPSLFSFTTWFFYRGLPCGFPCGSMVIHMVNHEMGLRCTQAQLRNKALAHFWRLWFWDTFKTTATLAATTPSAPMPINAFLAADARYPASAQNQGSSRIK